jgi:hypothetical protein
VGLLVVVLQHHLRVLPVVDSRVVPLARRGRLEREVVAVVLVLGVPVVLLARVVLLAQVVVRE